MIDWPVAELDCVARMRVLAAGLPHAFYAERVIDAPIERVWEIAGDLERGVPRFEGGVRAACVIARDGDRVQLVAEAALGLRMHFDAILRPGWCVMRSRVIDIGMAAAPEDEGRRTRFGHFEGPRFVGRLLRPYLRHSVRGDLDRLEALAVAAAR